MRLEDNKIKKGGTLSYDAELDHIILEGWHFDGLEGPYVREQAIQEVINAMRRNLDRHKKRRKKQEEMVILADEFNKHLKPEGAPYALAG